MTPNKRRWITAGFFFLSGLLTATWSSRIPDVQHQLQLNNAAWGTVLMAIPVGMLTALAFSGWLVTRFGSRKAVAVSCIAVALILCIAAFASFRIYLMLALFFMGFFRTLTNIGANATAIEVQQVFRKPIMSSFHGIWSLACLLAAGIGTLMIVCLVSVKIHFFIIAAVGIVLALLLNGLDQT